MGIIFLSLIKSEYMYNMFLPILGIIYNHILDSSNQIYTIISLILAIKFVSDYTHLYIFPFQKSEIKFPFLKSKISHTPP